MTCILPDVHLCPRCRGTEAIELVQVTQHGPRRSDLVKCANQLCGHVCHLTHWKNRAEHDAREWRVAAMVSNVAAGRDVTAGID